MNFFQSLFGSGMAAVYGKAILETILITGIGIYEGKQITATFTIKPATLSGTSKITHTERVYHGKPITLQPGEYSLTKMSTTYTPDVDYVLSYTNNTDAGTATVTATGQGNYTGTVDAQFTISALSVDDSDDSM